jgi:hypothetical protein
VVVSSYSHDESEQVPRRERAVPAALPTRATRDPNDRQPHRLIQSRNGCGPDPGAVPSAIKSTPEPFEARSKREDNWIRSQRKTEEEYLKRQRVDHLGVGEFPAFHVHPYVALWGVQSRKAPGWVGWWAISGELPSDRAPNRVNSLRQFSNNSWDWSPNKCHEAPTDSRTKPGRLFGRQRTIVDPDSCEDTARSCQDPMEIVPATWPENHPRST